MRRPRTITIYPRLFMDEGLSYCSPGARLYFIYLWMHSEDDGTISTADVQESHVEWPESFAIELANVNRLIQVDEKTIQLVDRCSPHDGPSVSHHKSVVDGNRRRARKLSVEVDDLTAMQWAKLVISENSECAYCHKKHSRLAQEHMVPLVRGGSHTLSNIAPACKSCNSSKGYRTPLEYVFGVRLKRKEVVKQ